MVPASAFTFIFEYIRTMPPIAYLRTKTRASKPPQAPPPFHARCGPDNTRKISFRLQRQSSASHSAHERQQGPKQQPRMIELIGRLRLPTSSCRSLDDNPPLRGHLPQFKIIIAVTQFRSRWIMSLQFRHSIFGQDLSTGRTMSIIWDYPNATIVSLSPSTSFTMKSRITLPLTVFLD